MASDANEVLPGKPENLLLEDVRAIFSLLCEFQELRYDPVAQRRRLMDGLCELLECGHGYIFYFESICADDPPQWTTRITSTLNPAIERRLTAFHEKYPLSHDPLLLALVRGQNTRESYFYTPEQEPSGAFAEFNALAGSLGLGDGIIEIIRTGSHRAPATGIVLYRAGNGSIPFSDRDRLISRFTIDQAHYLWKTGRILSVRSPLSTLSHRQRQVFEHLLAGHPPKLIAQQLGLSLHTVREYVQSLYRKLRVEGRDELLSYYLSTARPGNAGRDQD